MSSPLLQGGRKRRHNAVPMALAILLAPLAVAAAAYLALGRDEQRRDAPTVAIAAGSPPPRARLPVRPSPTTLAEPLPKIRLAGVDAFSLRFRKPPGAGILVDLKTGEVLWRHQPLQVLPIASLTKIMTALVVTERAKASERVRITRAALRYSGSGVGVLPKGKRVRLETLLNGLLIVSGNDTAIALAVHVARSERRFVRLMNRRARQLGLRCTRFWDSHGLSHRNRSCPRDLAVMTQLAMGNRRIRRVVRRRQVSFRFPVKGRRLFLSTHNPLYRLGYPGAIGLKTGYTNAAGRCFVGVARRGGRTLAVVLLNSPNPVRHSPRLLNAGFRLG